MHSIASRSLNDNNGMHKRFRKSVPPFYDDDRGKPFHGWGVYCDWQGWLFNDMTKDTRQDDDGKRRYSYERYYAIGDDNDKFWMNGRVVNPFCSKEDKDSPFGMVTRLRAYCFYIPKPIEVDNKRYYLKDRCSDLQPTDSQ